MDLVGQFLRTTSYLSFPTKGRLIRYWMQHRNIHDKRLRKLTGNASILCDLSIPYEAMAWLKQEEERELSVLRKILLPGQTFVDCGANIGLWSIVASSSIGSTGKVYAFEPNPKTAKKLRENLALGNIENVTLVETAVGDRPGMQLLQAEEAHNQARIVINPNQSTILVPTITLDSMLSDIKIDACKLDVEGYELKVLQGGKEMLRKNKPWLCIEFNTILSAVNNLEQWPVHQFLSELGYKPRLFTDAENPTPNKILGNDWTTSGYCNLYYSVL
jgi:FkbM family methyltransferase